MSPVNQSPYVARFGQDRTDAGGDSLFFNDTIHMN
jgi:hypothetical protein